MYVCGNVGGAGVHIRLMEDPSDDILNAPLTVACNA